MDFVQNIISAIIQKYFISLHTVLVIYNSTNNGRLDIRYMDGVTEGVRQLTLQNKIVVSWINVADLTTDDLQDILDRNVEIGIQGYISILSNTTNFISTKYHATENSILRQRDKIFLMLSTKEQPQDVLSDENLYLYPRHLLIVPKNESTLELWTQKYNGRRNNKKPILLDTLHSTNVSREFEGLFPDKLRNLKGRPLKIASTSYLPYMEAYFVGKGQGNVRGLNSNTKDVLYRGTETCLIIEFCRHRKCTIKVETHGPDNWGGVYENGSSDGMIGSTYEKRTEVAIGCLYNWFNDLFDVSHCIAKSAVTLLAPAPLPLQPYQAIVMPFTRSVWTLIIISLIISSIMHHYLERSERTIYRTTTPSQNSFVISTLQIAAIFFQQSYISDKIQKRAARICVGCLLIATIILENSYTGRLKSLLTVPQYTEPIDTVQKFVDSNLKWGAPVDLWVAELSESDIPYEKILYERFESKSYSELRNLTFGRTFGLGIERMYSGLYSFGNYIQADAIKNLIVVKDNVYYDYTRIISVRGWPLMGYLNEFVQQTLEHGLWTAWEKQMVRKYFNPKTENILISQGETPLNKPLPTILNLSHVSGIFLILVFGYMLGFLSFFSEFIAARILCSETGNKFP